MNGQKKKECLKLKGEDEKKDKILKWTIIGLLTLDLLIAIIC